MTLSLNKRQIYTYPGRVSDALYMLIEEVESKVASGSSYEFVTLESSAAKTDFTPTMFMAPADGEISEIVLIPNGAISKSDSDYLTLDVINGETQIVTAQTTKSTGGVALARGTAISFTLTEGTISEDDVIAFRGTNTGSSGKAFPGGLIRLQFEPS